MTDLYTRFKSSNWFRLLRYLTFWIISSIIFIVPVVIFFYEVVLLRDSKKLFHEDVHSYYSFSLSSQLAAVSGVLAATYFVVKTIEKRSLRTIKVTIDLKALMKGFLFGILLMISFAFVALITGIVDFSYTNISSHIIFGFVFYLLVSIGEEIIVRGYVLSNLREVFNDYTAIIISSLFFGGLHIFNDSFTWIGFCTISLSGILIGIFCVKLNTISGAVGLHWAWNFIQGPIAGFNVSGHYEKGIFNVTPLASPILTGGNFGAEGSLVLIPITALAIYLAWKFL